MAKKKETKAPVEISETSGTEEIKVPIVQENVSIDDRMKQERVMYVGPTIVGFGTQNTVYDRIPDGFKVKLDEYPELRNLFIEITEYPRACEMLREKKGYIFSAYMKALEIKNGGNTK